MKTSAGRRGAGHHLRPLAPTSIVRSVVAFTAGAWLVLAMAVPVLAHADLVKSTPKDKAVLTTPPTRITLTFNEALEGSKSSFKLVGGGATIGTGKVSGDAARTMALDGLALGPGAYEIRWTAASPDGHIIRGKLTFTVTQPTPAPATPTPAATEVPTNAPNAAPSEASTAAPTAAMTAAPSAAAPEPTPAASPAVIDGSAAASGTDVLIPIVVALAAVGMVGFLVLRRSRKVA